jgi:hypothetical protein
MSVEIQLNIPDDNGGQVHATERYALSIQQTTEG